MHKKTTIIIVVAALCFFFSTKAQHTKLTGQVNTSLDNKSLPGASIRIRSTHISSYTNQDGRFILSTTENSGTIVISHVGYKTKELSWNSTNTIFKISLEEDNSELKEVEINAGYYTVKNKLRTGSISRVNSETISSQPVSNPLAALIGRVPGLEVTQQTGIPGGGFGIQIRGVNSITSGSQPLYLIDGVPFGSHSLASSLSNSITPQSSPFNSLSPSDIESIEILKDADATAIYGSRGANGVILITTKKGKSGRTTTEFNYYHGIGKVSRKMDLLNTSQYLIMRNEAFKNDVRIPTTVSAPDLLVWDQQKSTDWQNILIGGTAINNNMQGSLSGGNGQISFSIRGVYGEEGTVFPGEFKESKGSGALNLNYQSIDSKFKTNFSTQYAVNSNNLFSYDLTSIALTTPPNSPDFLDTEGKLVFTPSLSNPYQDLYRKYNAGTRNLIGNLNISYQLLPQLMVKLTGGYTKTERNEIRTLPSTTIGPTSSSVPSADFGTNSSDSWIAEPQVNYQNKIGKSTFSALLGSSFQQSIRKSQLINASGYQNDQLLENIQAATNLKLSNSDYFNYRYQAIFGRLNYNLSDTYLLNFTMRRDGSSRFGKDRQFANFYALGAAWIFSNEDFIKQKLPFLSFGKLRASYGTTGNDQIGDYQFLELWKSTASPYGGTSGLYPVRIANPNYAWEISRKLETGIELGLIKDRIRLSVAFYQNRSSNQLVGYSLPPSSGAISVQSNLPALVENRGLEFEISTTNIQSGEFKWESTLNLTLPRNKLLAYPDIEKSAYASTYTIGKSLQTPMLFHLTGVDPKTGIYLFQDLDQNGKGATFPTDLLAIYDLNKKAYGGIGNTFSYKGFQLDVFLQFTRQLGTNYMKGFVSPGLLSNQPEVVQSRWQNEGSSSTIQKFSSQAGSEASRAYLLNGDHKISDASYLRLKNVSLSYYLSRKILEKIKLQNVKIYFQGQNLFTITKYRGLDPENQNTGSLPPLSIYSFGIQLTL
ncbi:SusC/RagA family TonB-linked outer membrane protein [Pedobacter sp. KBW06]|uniref:SusC/RagA family TonB-linked outer membrane protein n=1 Tax=Pedobacter sp. KBW06 TaxID=2153359 RepID=UPI000F5B4FC8|nr:SusC/RagA family TonB-linked outer membrane protein [Pedobacter sp. KBW06]RQO75621.1 SusC/RagA family TonB-linked outer membrane protein [Pedobacter sp. KBW06]